MIIPLLFIIFIATIAYISYKSKALSISGAISSVFVGASIYFSLGFPGLVPLGLFFASSSMISKWKKERKAQMASILEKGERRDYVQVLANGGIPVLISIFNIVDHDDRNFWFILLTISFACANADTWASEIGSLSRIKPILLFPPKFVEKGTSGAVTVLGTFASILGSSFVALGSSFFIKNDAQILPFIILFGFIGALIDTLFGCFFQRKNKCLVCHAETEKRIHCGEYTVKTKGFVWMNNDAVNFLSIFIATVIAYFILDKN